MSGNKCRWKRLQILLGGFIGIHELYMNGTITKEEFLELYRNPYNYRPELLSTNRGISMNERSTLWILIMQI